MMRWLRWCWPRPPRCHVCHGKGWISPQDADHEIEKAWTLFMAGYDHAKATANEATSKP